MFAKSTKFASKFNKVVRRSGKEKKNLNKLNLFKSEQKNFFGTSTKKMLKSTSAVLFEKSYEKQTSGKKLSSKEIIEREQKFSAHNYHPLEFVWERAKGSRVWDPEGKEYLDFLAAYSAANQGHCHPRLINALTQQASLLDIPSRAFFNNKFGEYAQFVTSYFGYESVLPMNTGAEGVETSMKVARKWGYSKKKIPANEGLIVTFSENFHGRTISIISMSTDPSAYTDFGPLTKGFVTIKYGDENELKNFLEKNAERTIAVLIEPIQGEAGIKIPKEGYLQTVSSLCKKHNVLMIADEIQTGLGRTGKLLACDWENVRPDILVLGKALSGGMFPVSAVLADWEIMGCIQPGTHGSTYGGHPIGAAVAIEALKILKEESLIENSQKMGEYFRNNLKNLNSPYVKDLRGRGLMNAIEVVPDLPISAYDICYKMGRYNPIGVLAKPTHDHIIRFTPPLSINKQEMDIALDVISNVFKSLTK